MNVNNQWIKWIYFFNAINRKGFVSKFTSKTSGFNGQSLAEMLGTMSD